MRKTAGSGTPLHNSRYKKIVIGARFAKFYAREPLVNFRRKIRVHELIRGSLDSVKNNLMML